MENLDNLDNLYDVIDNKLIPNSIDIYFPSLNTFDKNILKKYYKNLVSIIYFSFFENNFELFKQKMFLNEYSDSISIMLLLLPYINSEKSDTTKLSSFNQLVIEKVEDVNISKKEPKYIYTNFQYNRCNRKDISEINFTENHIKDNFIFLLNTIKTMSSKLYINWIDTIPFTMSNYKESLIYKNTKELYNNKELKNFFINDILEMNNSNNIKNLQSLSINDLYETITNELYYQIKNVKWLLYNIYDSKNKRYLPIGIILNNMLKNNILDIKYNDETIKSELTKYFDNILNLFKNNLPFEREFSIKSDDIFIILKYIAVFFCNYYKDINFVKSSFENKKLLKIFSINNLDKNLDLDINDDEIFTDKFSKQNIIEFYQEIDYNDLFTFLLDSYDTLKNSYYAKFFFHTNKDLENKYLIIPAKKYNMLTSNNITIKDIYNLAKSFCHIYYNFNTNDMKFDFNKNNKNDNNYKFTLLPRYWVSLTDKQKDIIYDRLYSDNTKWFNIKRNLEKRNIKIEDIKLFQENIIKYFKENIIDILFESMIRRGVLSKFAPNINVMNKSIISADERTAKIPEKISNIIQNKDILENSYYYLTSTPYISIDKFYLKSNNKIEYLEYNEWLTKGKGYSDAWYAAYALDWICQLNFYNKFLNNRVIYVTGSTGTGKSTQVPKLVLYSYKAILYNSSSKIICTQPRQNATENNGKRVSLECGVPIDQEQYIDITEKETIKTIYKPYNIQFKHQKKSHVEKNNNLVLKFVTDGSLLMELTNLFAKKEPSYNYNLYESIIIDEAHEHNINMDLLLSYMKYATLYNNTIKLIIVSATMDDDEPTYRRFYRDINDNKLYPLNYEIEKYKLDRINIDRRFNMSPPGKTTRYTINEKYIEDIPVNLRNEIDLAIHVINNTQDGFLLLFQPGLSEIEKTVKELNLKTPKNVIAIPYYSELKKRPDLKEFVENIDDRYKKLAMDKNIDFLKIIDPTVGNNKYDRIIIVATNIAEASITIANLKYVIETGTQKSLFYDYKSNLSILKKVPISDSSRLQRRGRVGRKQAGDVYYLYKKGTTEGIKTMFNICSQDISEQLYEKLFKNFKQDKIILNYNNDPNNPQIKLNYNDLEKLFDKYYKNFLSYFNLNNYYTYCGNLDHYDYENYENFLIYYNTGYSFYNLYDNIGKFYIIHPEELYLKRNIRGDIIEINTNLLTNNDKNKNNNQDIILNDNVIISKKMDFFWNKLKNEQYLDYTEDNIFKLDYGRMIIELKNLFNFESFSLFKTFLYSFVFNNTNDIIKLISLIKVSNGKPLTFFKDNESDKKNIIINDFIIKKYKGDFELIMIILNNLHNYLDSINYFNIFSKFKKFKLEDTDYYYKNRSITFINELKNYCDKYNLSFQMLQLYLLEYAQLYNNLYFYQNKLLELNKFSDIDNEEYLYLDKITNILKSQILNTSSFNLIEYDKLLLCFILSFPYNIVKFNKKINNSKNIEIDAYTNIYYPYNTSLIGITGRHSVETKYLYNYIFYYTFDPDKNKISFINYLPSTLLSYLQNIYSIKNYKYHIENINNSDNLSLSLVNGIKNDIIYNNNDYNSSLNKKNNENKIIFNNKIKEILTSKI